MRHHKETAGRQATGRRHPRSSGRAPRLAPSVRQTKLADQVWQTMADQVWQTEGETAGRRPGVPAHTIPRPGNSSRHHTQCRRAIPRRSHKTGQGRSLHTIILAHTIPHRSHHTAPGLMPPDRAPHTSLTPDQAPSPRSHHPGGAAAARDEVAHRLERSAERPPRGAAEVVVAAAEVAWCGGWRGGEVAWWVGGWGWRGWWGWVVGVGGGDVEGGRGWMV